MNSDLKIQCQCDHGFTTHLLIYYNQIWHWAHKHWSIVRGREIAHKNDKKELKVDSFDLLWKRPLGISEEDKEHLLNAYQNGPSSIALCFVMVSFVFLEMGGDIIRFSTKKFETPWQRLWKNTQHALYSNWKRSCVFDYPRSPSCLVLLLRDVWMDNLCFSRKLRIHQNSTELCQNQKPASRVCAVVPEWRLGNRTRVHRRIWDKFLGKANTWKNTPLCLYLEVCETSWSWWAYIYDNTTCHGRTWRPQIAVHHRRHSPPTVFILPKHNGKWHWSSIWRKFGINFYNRSRKGLRHWKWLLMK